MTYEEAKRNLIGLLGYLEMIGALDSPTYESLNIGIDVIEKAEKYRWHDLRKNPDDLPKKDGEYYAYQYCHYCRTSDPNSEVCEPMYTIIFVNDGKIIDCYEGGEIIAWKEIEPFEVTE